VILTGALSAAAAGGLAAAVTVTLTGNGGHPSGPPHFAAATTVAAVLDNAALAAQSAPADDPRPDQFVYLKLVEVDHYTPTADEQKADPGAPPTPVHSVDTSESWMSVSGSLEGRRTDVVRNDDDPEQTIPGSVPWCDNGVAHGTLHLPCKPEDFAAFKPGLPTTTDGMLAYLQQLDPKNPSPVWHAEMLATSAFWLSTKTDLTPDQQAALFHALAQVPNLQVVQGVTDAQGRTGVGVRVVDEGDTWTTIFDPDTFRLLGATFTNDAVTRSWAVAVPATVVDKVGQQP
jgi:hypothetical protein